jgi:hypothetical protein
LEYASIGTILQKRYINNTNSRIQKQSWKKTIKETKTLRQSSEENEQK